VIRFHFGKPRLPVYVVRTHDGMYQKDLDEPRARFIRFTEPLKMGYTIKSLYGWTFRGTSFFGVMRLGDKREVDGTI
jgi:hypothetical protein